jgi:D-threo-aldose 1-dehydrogenase
MAALSAITRVRLGRRGPEVTRLGFGGAPIGGLFEPVSDEAAASALDAVWDTGIRFVDTAPHYGAGLSERRIGAWLRGRAPREREQVVISTKVGRLLAEPTGGPPPEGTEGFYGALPYQRVFDYSRDGVLRSVEQSLARLGVDRVGVLLIHDPDEHWEQAAGEAYPTLHELRDQGVTAAIGAGMNQAEMLARFVRETDVDCVLLAGRYTLLDQRGLVELLPLCEERDVAVIAGGVFNSGVLADPREGATFDYGQAPPEVLDRARRLRTICARHGIRLPAAALRFPLAHPAVTSVLTGARSAAELRENVALLDVPVPRAVWQEMRVSGLLPAEAPVP